MLCLHGGGYCVGSPTTSRAWAARVARATGLAVVVPDYRLAPEHPYPAALDDALVVWRALASAGPAAMAGDSAGAALALTAAVHLRDAGASLLRVLVLISPWLDLAGDRSADAALLRRDPLLSPTWLARCARAYGGDRSLEEPDLSPVRHDLRGLPPMLVQAGADDVLAPDLDRLAERCQAAGVFARIDRRPGLWHDFPLNVGLLRAADDCLEDVAEALRATVLA